MQGGIGEAARGRSRGRHGSGFMTHRESSRKATAAHRRQRSPSPEVQPCTPDGSLGGRDAPTLVARRPAPRPSPLTRKHCRSGPPNAPHGPQRSMRSIAPHHCLHRGDGRPCEAHDLRAFATIQRLRPFLKQKILRGSVRATFGSGRQDSSTLPTFRALVEFRAGGARRACFLPCRSSRTPDVHGCRPGVSAALAPSSDPTATPRRRLSPNPGVTPGSPLRS